MHAQFTLLIADRNRHVRDFLRREFLSHGYCVQLAKDDRELLAMIEEEKHPDLIILDLEMPYTNGPEVLEQLQGRMPSLPVVVYTLMTDHSTHGTLQKAAAFLEKRGNNIDDLKALVEKVLREWYPHRCTYLGGAHEQIVDRDKGGSHGEGD
jgi:DNA-binding NtrC family response regulator